MGHPSWVTRNESLKLLRGCEQNAESDAFRGVTNLG